MTTDEIASFLSRPHTLQVATIGKQGEPHLAPMWYVVRDGEVWFRSFTKSQKIVNLARDPRLTVLVEEGREYSSLRGVMITGVAELYDDPGLVLEIYGMLAGRYPMIDDATLPDMSPEGLEAAFGRFATKNTAVRVVPERIVSWDHHKIGGGY